MFDVPSIKTARFLAFTEALLQVGHRYGGGVDIDIRTGSSPEGDKNHGRFKLVFMKAHSPHSNEKARHPRVGRAALSEHGVVVISDTLSFQCTGFRAEAEIRASTFNVRSENTR